MREEEQHVGKGGMGSKGGYICLEGGGGALCKGRLVILGRGRGRCGRGGRNG